GQFDGEISETEFFVHADLRPDTGIANVVGGTLEPGITAEFSGSGDRVKDPESLPCPNIESANIPLGVVPNSRSSTCTMRRAYDDRISGNGRSGVQPDFSGVRIQFLIVVGLQIENP